jgi:UDP-N-acetylglucosamine--N-acetylmuramyl-(pentapeptide) pyrophosphoryl-undecaprenol N-acetylglucosamine transferase
VNGRRYAVMAGGGTAGHLQPALAIAEALVDRGHDRGSIEFVGSERGQDALALDGRGFPVTLLPGRGVVRSLAPRDLVGNVVSLAELAVAAVGGLRLVARARPRVVVSVGGYASLPAALAAVVLRIPLVLVNTDAVPGAANRLFGRFARVSAVGWEGVRLPRAVVTGTPVRPEISAVRRGPADRIAARRLLGLPPDRTVVAIFGGSLGARRINRCVEGLTLRWRQRSDLAIYHVVGRRDWEAGAGSGVIPGGGAADGAGNGADRPGLVLVQVPFEERMGALYAAADVVVCRSGAMTVAELAVAGVPAVLVPLPGAPGDHQTANARVLERAGAAVLLADELCEPARLAGILDGLISDGGALDAMGTAASRLGRPDAAAAGAEVVEAAADPAERGAA